MAGEGFGAGRYAAFISYSHKDTKAARWLHRRIEGYRIPRRLVGTEGERGPIPARLTPVFRDREELPAAGDLSQKVWAALGASENLIVICSPYSAASPWVAKEIAAFRELHPGRPVFAAILEGDPAQCFPPSLRFETEGAEIEPLAADLRAEGDGKRLGLLKLVAGLTGVGLDALVQRDAQRRVRRVTAVTLAALTAMLAMAILTIFALNARAEAERQRAEAEGLVEFMLTDLRDRLEGVGRLDVLTAVNRRALDHYEGQDLEGLTADALERRARILHAMGEDDEKRGDVDRALAQFREATRTTAALLAADPNNPDRIFAHSQSAYWVGYIDYQRGRYAQARPAFERYKALSDRLVAIDPANPEWLKEAAYAEGNLCSIALAEPVDAAAALRSCSVALSHMEEAARRIADPSALDADLANRHAWLADAWFKNGRLDLSLAHRRKQERLLAALVTRDPKNMDVRDLSVTNQLALAGLEAQSGLRAEARRRLDGTLATVETLVRTDPSNRTWIKRRDDVLRKISTLTNTSR
jgi:tetratricopeptide (TPR) repeat protein